MKKNFSILFILVFLFSFAVYAQEDIWLGLAAETAMYSVDSLAFGGGLSFGYGTGTCIGLKFCWFASLDNVSTFELNFLFRYYLFGVDANSGPLLQLTAGPTIFARSGESLKMPSELGVFSAGLSFGWRFLFNRWFVEPAVRFGYPYIVGVTGTAGIRF